MYSVRCFVSALVLMVFMCLVLCSCGEDKIDSSSPGELIGTGSSSNYEIEDGVKLKIRTSSDYYIDGEDIVMTAVVTNETDGYIPICSPVGANGREGALVMSVSADGHELVCSSTEWGKTLPVSMTDAAGPYYYLLEPGQSVTCTFVYRSSAVVGGSEYPLWNTTVIAQLTVQMGQELDKRQGGLAGLEYSPRTVTVEITFDGTADKPE